MISRFGRPVSVLSMVTNTVLDYIFHTHANLLTDWNSDLLSAQALKAHAQANSRKRVTVAEEIWFYRQHQ